ncbi:MAG: MFS transporter [Oscillospiraceae bacterium]|jgi:Na+/melibiose symporter-like transporter|nr:MFS transporter [Oscillospiraceae bacterium]
MAEQTAQLKLNYKKTILTGFGFMASCVAWAVYDPYITKLLDHLLGASPTVAAWSEKLASVSFLQRFMESQGNSAVSAAGRFTIVPLLIGFIMTFDNIFGVIFQPTFGKLSDRCHSRFGKRRPFILFGAPVSALLFALIPLMGTIPATMVCVILFVFVMSLWRAPVVALMPDLTPPELRSQGNAVINLMGGIGTALATVLGTIVTAFYLKANGMTKDSPGYDEFKTFPYVFLSVGAIMVLGMVVVMLFVKEKDSRLLSGDIIASRDEVARRAAEKKAEAEQKAELKAQKLGKAERRSLLFMLGGLFFLYCGSNAIQTFFALFASEILHRDTAEAQRLMLVFAVATAAAAIPAGWLGKKLGRKKTILLGLGIFLAAFVVFFAVFAAVGARKGFSLGDYVALNRDDPNNPTVSATAGMLNALVFPVLILAGFGNMLITVNTLPLVLEIGGLKKVGTFTGYYYTATFSAQIASPIVYGFFRMFSGTYLSLFYYSPIAFALAAAVIVFVRHGEAIPEKVLKEIEEKE